MIRVNGVPVTGSELILNDVPITDATTPIDTDDLVFLDSVSLISEDELEFSVVSNSNEELVDASITEGELILDYLDGETGEATITLEATNLLGESVEEEFIVGVEADSKTSKETPDPITGAVFSFLDLDTGVYFYANSEAERDELLADEPDLIAELGYKAADPLAKNAREVFSFFNEDTGAYLYTVNENKKEFIEDNFDSYFQESDSFFVFAGE